MPGTQQQYLMQGRPRCVNLFITNLCNRSCSFCFLNDWITHEEETANFMSLMDLHKLIRWLKNSDIYAVKLAGGEPMLHPELVDLIHELMKNNITIDAIFTNGLGDTGLYKKVVEITSTNWLVNVTDPETYTNEEWELLNRNLELLKWKNENKSLRLRGFDTSSLRRLCLSMTFYKPDQEYNYIIELAKKYCCPVIRYDVSRPSCSKTNIYVDFNLLREIKPTLIDFVRSCMCEWIKTGVDCALPFCIFTQKELMFLYAFSNFYSICIPHLDVMPDLTVEYCTSLRGILPSYKIQEMNASEIFQGFFSMAKKYRNHPYEHCKDCYNYRMKLCQGYCLRFKYDLIKKEEEKRFSIKWPKFSK